MLPATTLGLPDIVAELRVGLALAIPLADIRSSTAMTRPPITREHNLDKSVSNIRFHPEAYSVNY
jgi:hypothetical protein